jgi:hypothetical protein
MKELKPGDLVRCYGSAQDEHYYHPQTGTVHMVTGHWLAVCLKPSCERTYTYHRKQVRLITRKKVAPITRKNIEDAWNNWCSDRKAKGTEDFIETLESIIGRKIK